MRWLSVFGAVAFALAASPVFAAPVSAEADYLLSLGGINIATASVGLEDDGSHYALKIDAHVSGLGNLVSTGMAQIEASGSSAGRTLESQQFDLLTHTGNDDFKVNVQFARGSVAAFEVTPPLLDNINRVPIERSQLTGVGDLVSAFVLKGQGLDQALCDHRFHIFTGVERFDLTMSYLRDDKATSLRTGYQGPLVQCRLKYTPISGHFTTSETTNYLAKSDQLFVWYAPLGTSGYFIPYRVLIATSMGDLSMVLTGLKG
jgi:Protein of unknown function (DUF3108)